MEQSQQLQQENEEYLMEKIQELIPDIRSQLHSQILQQLTSNNKRIIEQQKEQIKKRYSHKLQEKIREINRNIKSDLDELKQHHSEVRAQAKQIKRRKLTQDEEAELIEETVDGILENEDMVEQIKKKMQPKVQQKVIKTLEIRINNELEAIKEEHELNYQNERELWENQRYQHWKAESQRELEELAEQYKELQCKKGLIVESLEAKKVQKESLKRKQKAIMEHNSEVVELKRQIKMLQG